MARTPIIDAQLDRFLELFVKGYLLHDIDTLMRRANAAPGATDGACGYPLLMTVFSGIELLGALTSTRKFSPRNVNHKYFRAYWEKYLYTTSPRRGVGRAIYPLARHGIAHGFMVKGNIVVVKTPGAEWMHLTRNGDEIAIHVLSLAADFVESYARWETEYLVSHRTRVKNRLGEILAENEIEAAKKKSKFRRLPAPRQLPMPVVAPPPGAIPPMAGPVPSDSARVVPVRVSDAEYLVVDPTSSFRPK